ncbi:PAS domain S-box protein (macronuclear) [Tetrahymena thermophila SB210]|uniref:PAS domain S-box protein n=1 Tax=Tetrahymena thermophila (strain SB210) TaxID=312017 RepID=I7MCH1_TETTS|nr:PAS domain S-box protein [Tetrahymena thermophila SB210]EAR83935.1 PAS domain S-box protein [Tetrahymena thermophila SB210]|eukprot:XP_001031598.1 PAS domain S-box protein [Tetrahymena thermophila SB210]
MFIMLGNRGKVALDESKWEQLDRKIRTSIYALMHDLLQANSVSPLIYKLLLLIEGIQIAYYSINPTFGYLWSSGITNVLQQALKYFQFNGSIQNIDQSIFLTILYIVFIIQVIGIVLFIYQLLRASQKNKKSSTFSSYVTKLLSIYGILINTIAFIPFFNIFIQTLYCSTSIQTGQNLNCYNGIYFVHFSLAVLGMILLLLFTVLFLRLYIDLNPCSTLPFAQPQSQTSLVRTVLKILLPMYTTFDPNANIAKPFIVCMALYQLLVLGYRYISAPLYNRSVQQLSCIIDVCCFWISCASFICALIDAGSVGILYMIIGAPFISVTYLMIINYRYNQLMSYQVKNFKKENDLELYINVLINLIENRDKPNERIQLEGVIKYHAKNCSKTADSCNCQQLILDKEDDNNGGGGNSSQGHKKWYLFLRNILQDGFEKFQKSSRLHLLHAYIQQGKLQNKFKALFELMITEEQKPNLQEEFSIYRYKHLIEEELIEGDLRGQENKGIEVNNIVTFQNKLVVFLNAIEKSVSFHLEFWNKLLEEQPDIQKLLQLGSKITNTVENTSDLFEQLQEMNPNHIKCLEIYGNFLKEIVNDEQEGVRVIEKAEYVSKSNQANKQFVDTEKIKYGENSNTCIITVSGNLNSVGIVTNSNNEVFRMLGFQKNEIIDQNISKIMPRVYGNLHDSFIHRYLETSESRVIGVERSVMCLNKQGYIVPCTLMIKVLPNLDDGIQIVGFLKEIENQDIKSQLDREEVVHYLIYRDDNQQIQGISETCHEYFGIPAQLIQGNTANSPDFTIDSIAPAIVDVQNLTDLKSPQGMVVQIDTTYIQQNFLIDEEEFENDEQYEQEADYNDGQQNGNYGTTGGSPQKKSRFRVANIRVNLIEEQEFGDGVKVNVIKFIEVDKNDENLYQQKSADIQNMENLKTTQKQTMQQEEDKHSNMDNQDYEEEGSNVSGTSANDEMRQLKDFKAMISEKTVPKSIKILTRTVFILILILIALSGYDLGFKLTNKSDVNEAINAIYYGYLNPTLMEEVNYYTRMLQMLGNYFYGLTPGTSTASNINDGTNNVLEFQAQLDNYVTQLQTNVFTVIRYQIQMNSRKSSVPADPQYTIYSQTQTGTITTDQKLFTDAIFAFITASSTLKSVAVYNFVDSGAYYGLTTPNPGYQESTSKNIYYLRQNGLFVLKDAAYTIAQNFYNFYYNMVDGYVTNYRVVMIIAIIFLVISQLILIPIVFNVIKTNNRVLSLFGYIPNSEIKELAMKCERFIQDFLAQKEIDELKDDDQAKNNDNNQKNNRDDENGYELNNEEGSENKNEESVQVNPLSNNQLQKGGKDHKKDQNQDKKDKDNDNDKDKKQNQEDQEYVDQRAQQLLNQKDNNKKLVIFKFGIMAAVFITYYVVLYVLSTQFISNIENIFVHLQCVCLRPSYIKYLFMYTIEDIVEIQTGGAIDTSTNKSLRTIFSNNIYNNENLILKSIGYSFPSQLSSYVSLFTNAQTQNVCTAMSSITDQDTCGANSNQILKSGLQTAIVAYDLKMGDLISAFGKTPYPAYQTATLQLTGTAKQTIWRNTLRTFFSTSSATSTAAVIFANLQQQIAFLRPAFDQLNNSLLNGTFSYLNYRSNTEIIIFSIYIVIILIVFIFIWIPYLNGLNIKIWRTKGMLNMIPMDVINKNDQLKNAFTNGEILQAVK